MALIRFENALHIAFKAAAVGALVAGGVVALAADAALSEPGKPARVTDAYAATVLCGLLISKGFAPLAALEHAHRAFVQAPR